VEHTVKSLVEMNDNDDDDFDPAWQSRMIDII
jgi:hypothetical protein